MVSITYRDIFVFRFGLCGGFRLLLRPFVGVSFVGGYCGRLSVDTAGLLTRGIRYRRNRIRAEGRYEISAHVLACGKASGTGTNVV